MTEEDFAQAVDTVTDKIFFSKLPLCEQLNSMTGSKPFDVLRKQQTSLVNCALRSNIVIPVSFP